MEYSLFTRKNINPESQYYLHLVVIILLIGIVYYPTLDAPFTFDDYPNIVTNQAITISTIHDLPKVFQTEYSGTRPLAMLSFAINHLINGLNVFGYHLVNILIHILASILLYKILVIFPQKHNKILDTKNNKKELYNRQTLAFWGTILWAVNPVQTQAVTYIVQRMTSMATLFYFAAIYTFILFRKTILSRELTILLILIFFLLGMTSKEIVITLPVTLLLIDYLFFSRKITQHHLKYMAMIAIFVVGAIFYYLQDGLPDFFAIYPKRNFSPVQRIMTEWRIVWHYISLYFFPLPSRIHLSYDYSISTGFLAPWTTLTSFLGITGCLTTIFFYRFRFPHVAFAIFYFFITLSLESTFLNLEIAFIHRLYLPTAFLVYSILITFQKHITTKISVILIVILGLLSYWTIIRNDEWNRSHDFWKTDYERGAGEKRSYNNQAAYLIDFGNFEDALPIIEAGLKNAEGEERRALLYNLGMVLYNLNRYQESLTTFKTISKEFGGYSYTYVFIGQSLLQLNKYDDAKVLAEQLLSNKNSYFQGEILRSNILRHKGNLIESEEILINLKNITPQNYIEKHQKINLELALVYMMNNKPRDAYELYLEVVKRSPQTMFVWITIYKMLKAGGDEEKAKKVKAYLTSKGIAVKDDK